MDITGTLKAVTIEQKTSAKGYEYVMLTLTFANGYNKRVLLEEAEYYVIQSLVKSTK
jgi:hypothetical protein